MRAEASTLFKCRPKDTTAIDCILFDILSLYLAHETDVYANRLLPTCCMFTVREIDILNSTAMITRRMIEEFRCADAWIDIVRYDCFERLRNRKIDSGNGIPYEADANGSATEPMRRCREVSL